MAAPAGTAGGAGTVPPVSGAAATEKPNPRRPRPNDMPMTEFLMQIGRENRPLPQDASRKYATDRGAQIQEALLLNDIVEIDTTQQNLPPDIPPVGLGGYPIYQFSGPVGDDLLMFTEDPSYGGQIVSGYPPVLIHAPKYVHSGMAQALWGGFCYDNVGKGVDTEQNYDDLLSGIAWRYAGEGKDPEFTPATDCG